MCGISAILSRRHIPEGAIEKMVSALNHRGPDAQGVQRLSGCELGHTRLSIIDLQTGSQPMSDGRGRLWITFNGEIYNYQETRSLLQRFGHSFITSSDTEIILASYSQWGAACVDRFRGMFAFALWDEKERSLFAARDPFGEKPFYYAVRQNATLIMASEIKSIIASGLVTPQIDLNMVDAYLALGYVPPDRTIYSNVQALPPGHCLTWSKEEIKVFPYWQPVLNTRSITVSDAGDRLQELLQQAVKRQMVADVPVGAFLSGGLDSSTVVALMQLQNRDPVKTFSVGFGNYINELPYAGAVAKKYRTEHHEIDLGTPDVPRMLLRMAEVYDEPFADSSNIPTYLMAEFARQYVKVVLTGDGADELFGGYSWTYPALAKSAVVPESVVLWLLLRSFSKVLRHRWKSLALNSAACGLAARWPDMWSRQVAQSIYIKKGNRERIWGKRAGEVRSYHPGSYFSPPAEVQGANKGFYFDLKSYLPGDILVKVDRAAMAHGLETRAPFLDRDLAEFALSLPVNLKVDDRTTKVLLQKSCERFWPDELRGRNKQGFGSPIRSWLEVEEVKDLARSVFSPSSRLAQLLPGISSRPSKSVFEAWILLVLGVWLETRNISV